MEKHSFFNTSFNNGHDHYANFGKVSLRLPTMEIKTVALWFRRTGQLNGSDCLINGPSAYFSQTTNFMSAYADGTRRYNQNFSDGKWHKVIFTDASFSNGVLFSADMLRDYSPGIDAADLRLYSRNFTEAELANPSDDLPSDGIVARYDFGSITPTHIKEATGNGLDILITLGSPDPVPTQHDNGRFIFYGGAGMPGNLPERLYDQSGNKNHMFQTNPNRQPIEQIDAKEIPYFTTYVPTDMAKTKFWDFTWSSLPSDYTFYMVLDLVDVGNANNYLFDAYNHRILLGVKDGDSGNFYSTATVPPTRLVTQYRDVPNGKSMLTWNLSQQNGISIYRNNRLILRSATYTRAEINTGRLAADYSNDDYAYLNNKLHSFAAVTKSDSMEEMNKTWAVLAEKYDIPMESQTFRYDNARLNYFGTWASYAEYGGMKYCSNTTQDGSVRIELLVSIPKKSKVKLFMWTDGGNDAGTFDVLVDGEHVFGPKSNWITQANKDYSPTSTVGEFEIAAGLKKISIRLVQNLLPNVTVGNSLYFHKIEIEKI